MFTNNGILSAIGHTPLVVLNKLYPELPARFCAKLEMLNPGGSIKDRTASLMLSKALEQGKLKNNSTVIESSSGNMAIGMAQACRYLNLKLIVVTDPKINRHTLDILNAYGAQIESVSQPDANGNYLKARLQRVQELLDKVPDSYWPNQYANDLNIAAHFHTMEEIVNSCTEPPDYLLAATSTCGTIMGCAKYVHENGLKTKIVAVDAVGSVIFGTPSAARLIPGHGAGRQSDLLDESCIDHVLHISDEECIIGCRHLLNREAILAGGSAGAVVTAAKKLQSVIPAGSTCAMIFSDSGERYLDTIFNDEWVNEHFGDFEEPGVYQTEVKNGNPETSYLNGAGCIIRTNGKVSTGNGRKSKTHKIAIIGGGPKGMYGFERLAARFRANPPRDRVEIHIYNRTPHFGAGDIYRPDQPPYLLINNPIGDINIWIDEEPRPMIPHPLPLTAWLRRKEGRDVTENDYVDRASVGRYLIDGFELIASNLPDNVYGKYMVGDVTDLYEHEGKYVLRVKSAGQTPRDAVHRYDHLLLATGHPKNQPRELEKKFQEFATGKKGVGFIPFIYPAEQVLSALPPACIAGLRGMGLTFVDAVLALTEGRGGKFKRDRKTGKLAYHPSSREPKVIYPFSRSGLPMIPRKPVTGEKAPLRFFIESALEVWKNLQVQGKIDFEEQVLPLLKQEMIYAFYDIQMKQTGFKDDLSTCSSFAEVEYFITAYHERYPEEKRFDPDAFLSPLKGKCFSDSGTFNQYIQSYLTFYLQEALKGELRSPWAAAASVWRKAIPIFGKFYAFGGLTPDSQRCFDGSFRGRLNRITFGPPAASAEKLIALMEKGILNFEMAECPEVVLNKKTGTFVLESKQYNKRQPVHYLVDARISKVSLPDDRSLLYQNLLARGLISMYENELYQDTYQPGCIAVSREGFVIDSTGNINSGIAVIGTPTEGITFDNDTLSRYRNNFVSKWAAFICKEYTKSDVEFHAP